MKWIQASIFFLVSLPFWLSAQPSTAWGGRFGISIGRSNYQDGNVLREGGEGGFVWSLSAQGEHWWNLTPRWSVAAGLGARLNYHHLQIRRGLDDLAPTLAVNIAQEERRLRLRRAEHAATAATANGWASYSVAQIGSLDFRLLGGLQFQRLLVGNVNTAYQEPEDPLSGGALINLPDIVPSTASEPAFNAYFRDQMAAWQVNIQFGITLQIFSRRQPVNRFYWFWLYEQGLIPPNPGLNRPVRGIRGGTGFRFGR